MKYLVCKKQRGVGCDYTIGCGMRYDFIDAESVEDAIEKVVYPDGRDNYSALEGENALVEIYVVPVSYVATIDVKSIAHEIKADRKLREIEAVKLQEIAELRRLQLKYGR